MLSSYVGYLAATVVFLADLSVLYHQHGLSDQQYLPLGKEKSCPIDIPVTCTNTTPVADQCCFEAPGGILMQTQFWDYQPAVGNNHSFTLHGLWPDNCDGTYEQFCDRSLEIKKSIKSIIVDQFKDEDLYNTMRDTWSSMHGDPESLWVHEFNKHGTCMTTLRPHCYASPFQSDHNIYDYFKTAVELYKKLPTFDLLAQAGIVPSDTATYTKAAIAKALGDGFDGNRVFFKCDRQQALQEVWYFHHLKGSARNGDFIPLPSMMAPRCPDEGIHFYPKEKYTPRPPQPPGTKGHIFLTGHTGCLISNGKWYRSGQCATFRLEAAPFGAYNLKSSRGYCGFDSENRLACGRQYPARQFHFNNSTRVLSYGGKKDWCLDKSGSTGSGKYIQIPIVVDDGTCENKFQLQLQ